MQPRCPFLKFRAINGEVQDICSEMNGRPCILEYQPSAACQMYDDWLEEGYEEWLVTEYEKRR